MSSQIINTGKFGQFGNKNEENISFLMKKTINIETSEIVANGLDLINGHHATVEVLLSQVDGKWLRFSAVQEVQSASSVLLHSARFMTWTL